MPDQTRSTISATESPALFNVSPYVTRWMLYHKFSNGLDIDQPSNARMTWGKRMQPLVLAQAAEDLRLEVIPNDETYQRRGQLGCSRDAIIICPDRGPGALETKCVFDWQTWMREMDGGNVLPRHYEIQLQQQMYVGDGETPYKWGICAVWVAGDVHYFEREPIPELWTLLETEAAGFFKSVSEKQEPDPFGAPVEIPLLTNLFTPDPEKVLDLSADKSAEDTASMARLYAKAGTDESAAKKTRETIKAKLVALAKDHGKILLPAGISVKLSRREVKAHQRKASVSTSIKVHVPEFAEQWAANEAEAG